MLKHTEKLAVEHGILIGYEDDYTKLADSEAKEFFATQKLQVGSTGNLGLAVGIVGAALGYQTIVHMSAEAKEWKKELLRSKGVTVMEYHGDYNEAVKMGRAESQQDEDSYFIDDENSNELFLGYAVAAKMLLPQLEHEHIVVDKEHPLFVYLPCGVGGAPGGITFGLKQIFGENFPDDTESDFYEMEIGTAGLMRSYMARKCDIHFPLERKLSRFLTAAMRVYRVPEEEQAKVLAFIQSLDIKAIATEVMYKLFAMLEMKYDFKLSKNSEMGGTR